MNQQNPMLGAGGGIQDILAILMGGMPQGKQQMGGQADMSRHFVGPQGPNFAYMNRPGPHPPMVPAGATHPFQMGRPGPQNQPPAPVSMRNALLMRAMGHQ